MKGKDKHVGLIYLHINHCGNFEGLVHNRKSLDSQWHNILTLIALPRKGFATWQIQWQDNAQKRDEAFDNAIS